MSDSHDDSELTDDATAAPDEHRRSGDVAIALRFHESARERFQQIIAQNNGVEVFAIGTCDTAGLVSELDPLAYGNWDMVPAPAQNAQPGQVLIHNHPDAPLDPSDADISIASMYGGNGIGFYIVDNDVTRVRVVVEPFLPKPREPINLADLCERFAPGGQFASAMSGYEFRPQQIEMLTAVAQTFNNDGIAMIEAGTGTGKSFAYLAPAIAWATRNKQRVIISTNTINLQEQLLHKDIPALRERMGLTFQAVLLKGRGNYLSKRRLGVALRERGMLPMDIAKELSHMTDMVPMAGEGSRAAFAGVSDEAWEAAQSDADDCQRARCPNFNTCFFYNSRRAAAKADVIVANHHLVMADVAVSDAAGSDVGAIVPPYKHLIVDEAHNLEETATSYFTVELAPGSIRRLIGRLMSHRDKRGAAYRLDNAVVSSGLNIEQPVVAKLLSALRDTLPEKRDAAESATTLAFDELYHAAASHFHVQELRPGGRQEFRVTRDMAESRFYQFLFESLTRMHKALSDLTAECEIVAKLASQCTKALEERRAEEAQGLADAVFSFTAAAAKLANFATNVKFWLGAGDDHCKWLELARVRERSAIKLLVAPLNIAPLLRKTVFDQKSAVVLTSATLTVNKSFDFLARQIGLAGDGESGVPEPQSDDESQKRIAARTTYLQLDSPFDYQANCLLGVTSNIPSPQDSRFDEAIEPIVRDTIFLCEGRSLVLFTSVRAMRESHAKLERSLIARGVTPLLQGTMDRTMLVEAFRSGGRKALFAVSSFWEGVDIPGRALECVIITKLPFRVPSTPILEARAEQMDRTGGDSFRGLSIPLAVIRFKQGFGRLIRTKSDRGIVLVLDHRIVTKPYGKSFLKSLPPVRVTRGDWTDVYAALSQFYDGSASKA